MKLSFHGGAMSVTGANYLLEHGDTKILVDCGLAQGSKYAETENYEDFPYDASTIDFLFVTHSHIDHIGRMPKLYKEGFRGKVYATTATGDLMKVAMPDNVRHIMNEARNDGHAPLFDKEDMKGFLALISGTLYDKEIDLAQDMKATLHDAGHILGSTIVEIKWKEDGKWKSIYFSGDLGNAPTPFLRDTEYIDDATYLVVESTYGDRVHEERKDRMNRLIKVIKDTINRKGVLMIPSFAMERTQELLYELNEICNEGLVPRIPVFIDSPLAIKITEVYKQHSEFFNKDANALLKSGDDIFHFPGLKMTRSTDESKAINNVEAPKIIIAGSGMSQGGRIIHHEKRYLPDPKSTILFVGYQVDNSLGRRIQRGDKTVTIHGTSVPVNCHVQTISSYSAHADQPSLLKWVEAANEKGNLKKVFVVQGEEAASKTLASLIREQLGISAVVPLMDQVEEL